MATVLAGRVNQLLLIFTYVPVVEKSTCIVGKNDRLELGWCRIPYSFVQFRPIGFCLIGLENRKSYGVKDALERRTRGGNRID